MRDYCFKVKFENGDYQIVYSGTGKEAIILAQAEQIKLGRVWNQLVDEVSMLD